RVNMMITSDKYKEINAYIIDQISRGSTIYKAVGGFSDNEKFVINTIVSRGEYIKIKNYVKSIDPKAFVCISYVSEVVGEGFTYDPVDNPELEILPGGMS
ncbi:MAG: YitT family protein, partial [Finegoldia magna]|nr:YitT family protein [Finegoldia magna]